MHFPIGASMTLPPYVTNNKGLITLQEDENTNHPYIDFDNLCLFRCLALTSGEDVHRLNRTAGEYFHRYAGVGANKRTFQGISLDEISNVNTNHPYIDNLCLFRRLALTNGEGVHRLNRTAGEYFHRYTGGGANKRTFQAISLDEISDVENVFKININV